MCDFQNGRPSRSLKSKRNENTTERDPTPTPPDREDVEEPYSDTRRYGKHGNCAISPPNCRFLSTEWSEILMSHIKEDENNCRINKNVSEVLILINSDVISVDLQIYGDVGSARSL